MRHVEPRLWLMMQIGRPLCDNLNGSFWPKADIAMMPEPGSVRRSANDPSPTFSGHAAPLPLEPRAALIVTSKTTAKVTGINTQIRRVR